MPFMVTVVSLAQGDLATSLEQSFSDQSAAGFCQISAANRAAGMATMVVLSSSLICMKITLEREAQ